MLEAVAESGLLPDAMLRVGMRGLLRRRLATLAATAPEAASAAFVSRLAAGPVALFTDEANTQHYEGPAAFFEIVLGPRLKYSCCDWSSGALDLAAAELAMLDRTIERASLVDGQRVLELGCGWGSLTLRIAERFPATRVVAVSNSAGQRRFILERAASHGLGNVEVLTRNVVDFEPAGQFDRVVSVEMFEHLRNWGEMFRRIRRWLTPEGRLFLHVFCHSSRPYLFEADGDGDWMARHFFYGGLMPCEDLASRFSGDLEVVRTWRHDGTDYQRTAEAWLARLDAASAAAREALEDACGAASAARALQRWRMFFMACSELFGWDGGREWFVTHQLLAPRGEASR